MKILVFCEIFAYPTYTFIYNELKTLSENNEIVLLTCQHINKENFPLNKVIEIPFYENIVENKIRKTLRSNDLRLGARKFSFEKKIKKIVADFQPDVIHCHFGLHSWVFLENFAEQNIPIFLHFHGFDASHKLHSKRYCDTLRRLFARKDLTPIFVSAFMHKNVSEALGYEIKKWELLYYGTDCSFFTRNTYENTAAEKIFLQISSFAEKKGHTFTINAFKLFLDKNPQSKAVLQFAGDGFLRAEAEALVSSLGLEQKVQFLGLVNRNEAKGLMEKAHFFVHHSVTSSSVGDMEGIPNAIMEAMSMELPILSTYHSGIPELVENGVHGFLVAERDIDAYAESMQKVYGWEYKKENRHKVLALFERKQHGDFLEKIYQKAI